MTRSSTQRIAMRASKFDPPVFTLPPLGLMSEQVDLPAYELSLGLIQPEGSPILIAVWSPAGLSKLMPEQASQWADELIAAGQAVPCAPVIEAIRKLVRRAGEIAVEAVMRSLGCEGRA